MKPDELQPDKQEKDTLIDKSRFHPTEAGQGVKDLEEMENAKKSGKIRNLEVKDGESQGGVSDSLKGGSR